ncbi:pitrilysin family protein [Candidatus Thioglobus sp.]|jgi:zinc protease|uniref:M16 family metallopeptidase n=1 Tax=Candidatus Thioglobus sp. TaxID=2026721 RepID=UPI00175185F8|nr:pitrilysin family protein [Candidatus Thioglobus sp.]HIF47575.1 insulinase family protein [Candidatus Thioglobus sp.]HIL03196.1 insulinase family protein [Candidatus Thioglobus autotrophicus]
MKLFILLMSLIGSAQAQLEISQWQTPEGAKVLFTQAQGLPMLDVQLNFDAASSRDGEQFGLATLTNTLIGTATKALSEEQIINQFESLGSEFSTTSLKDMAIISMRSLTRDSILGQSLSIFKEVVTNVDFQQIYLSREKRQIYQSIEASKQNPASVANLKFDQLVFGDHAYSHAKIGTKDTINAIQLNDLKQFYRQYYVAKNLTIALVGDISKAQAQQIARQISHGLNIGKKAQANPMISPLKRAQEVHVNFPSEQTHLLIGQTGINRAHPDYYALYLGNHILGGSGLSSILSEQVREQRGLAYSVVSYFTKMKSNGLFLIKLQTKNSQTQQAKQVVLKMLEKFTKTPIDAQLLQDGKDNIIGGFSLETSSNANILTYLSIIGFYELPKDFLSSFTQKIDSINVQEVQLAFRRLIDLDKLIVLSVGDLQ